MATTDVKNERPLEVERAASPFNDGEMKDRFQDVDEFGAHRKTDPAEIALVRKLDLFIIPLLWLMYFFNFLDRNALANGRINNMHVDLGLTDGQFQTLLSILFVGYIAGQIPSNMILTKVRPSFYLAGFMLVWSIVTIMGYKARNYTDMLVLRFFLGVVEAPFYPGAVYVLSMLYTRKELASRMAIFYSGNVTASAMSGLVAAGIFEMDGALGIEGWRWMFIIQGALSLAVSLPAFYLLPDSALKTRWLTPEQRQLAHDRIVRDTTARGGEDGEVSLWKGFKQAACDWRTWAFCLMANMHFTTNGFKNLLPTVINTFGYDRVKTLGLTCPPYVLSGIVTILVSWSSGRRNERCLHIVGCKVFTILGFVICVSTLNIAARYVGIMIFVGATYGVNNLTLSWASSVMGETNQKRAIVIAICNTAGNLASVYSPYLWPDSDSPRYVIAMTSSIGFSFAVILIALGVRFMLRRINRKMREENPEQTNFYVT